MLAIDPIIIKVNNTLVYKTERNLQYKRKEDEIFGIKISRKCRIKFSFKAKLAKTCYPYASPIRLKEKTKVCY